MTEHDMLKAIKLKFADPGYIVLAQVRNGTGFQAVTRTADVLVFHSWPSRGYELWGCEIKVRRSDWLKELENPGKADEIARYCDRWFVVAPPDVVKVDELPTRWGLMVMGSTEKLVTKVKAGLSEPQLISRAFLAAMLRAAVGQVATDLELKQEYQRGEQAGYDAALQRTQKEANRDLQTAREDLQGLRETVQRFETAAGFSIKGSWQMNPSEKGRVVKQVLAHDFDARVIRMRRDAQGLQEGITRWCQDLHSLNLHLAPEVT